MLDGNNIELCKMKGYKQKGAYGERKLKYYQFLDLVQARALQQETEEKYYELIANHNQKENKKELKEKIYEVIKDIIIKQQQIQFRSPTSAHISENEGHIIRKCEVEKKFKIGYTKGTIGEDGVVSPLEI